MAGSYVLHQGMKMKGASSHHRTHDACQQGDGDRERVIKICIVTFPSIWVSSMP
jgi:hypothetical protein